MKKIFTGLYAVPFFVVALFLIHSCSSDSSTTNPPATTTSTLPLISPPVKAAIPTGFGGGTTTTLLDPNDIQSRFFMSGPTSIYNLLATVDSLITTTNKLSGKSTSDCLTQDPVSYTISPYGESVTMYGQCYTTATPQGPNDAGLFQFGVKDGVTYIYSAEGVERVAAVITPIAGTTNQFTVQAWIGLGYLNSGTWDSGSYGVMQLAANSSTKEFELSVAGIGFGYCGLQMSSNQTDVATVGSSDMGTTCNTPDALCVLSSDGTTSGDCTALTITLPALGRKAVTMGTNGAAHDSGETMYPVSGGNITLTGALGDDLYFGPDTPSTGLHELQ